MSVAVANPPSAAAQRIEELGRIILAYSEVTERLQQSHEQLRGQVETLREELSEKKPFVGEAQSPGRTRRDGGGHGP